jgi:hypothetical protein
MKGETMKTGIELITEERKRQIEVEGWTPEHDDEHTDRSLVRAAICFASPVRIYEETDCNFTDPWPEFWADRWDKRQDLDERGEGDPLPDPVTFSDEKRVDLLTKAGALIAAEIDRIQRANNWPDPLP